MTEKFGSQGQRGGESENLAEKGGEQAARRPGSASNLAVHFKGVSFPASRQELLRHCQQNNAPQEIQSVINNLPDQQFNSMADVMAAWGRETK